MRKLFMLAILSIALVSLGSCSGSREKEHDHEAHAAHEKEKKPAVQASAGNHNESSHGSELHDHAEHEGEHVGHEGEHAEHEGEHAEHDGDHAEHDEEHGDEEAVSEDPHAGHDHDESIMITEAGSQMAGIRLSKAKLGKIHQTLEMGGEVGFNEDRLVHVTPRFEGIVREVKFRIGDYVKEGDVLAVIESNESMSQYSIKAPISGTVIQKHASPGEFASNQESICVVADLANVWINLAVYPRHQSLIKTGLRVAVSSVGNDLTAAGTIQYVTPVLDATTRSMAARIVLPNPGNRWKPGTFVRARVELESQAQGIIVEKDAVQSLNGAKVVFVPVGEGKFEPLTVTTAETDDKFVRIESGLKPDLDYVAAGAFELKARIVTSSLGEHAGHGH